MFFAIVLAGCGRLTKGKAAGEYAITHFHDLYNEGESEVIWKHADPEFRIAASRQKFDDFMSAVQGKLGKVSSSTNDGWNLISLNLKTTVHMRQQTTFEKGQGTESFTFVVDGTNAALVAYNIQSMDLITR